MSLTFRPRYSVRRTADDDDRRSRTSSTTATFSGLGFSMQVPNDKRGPRRREPQGTSGAHLGTAYGCVLSAADWSRLCGTPYTPIGQTHHRGVVMAYENLLAPGRIGAMELRNRILLCPMGDELSEADGT